MKRAYRRGKAPSETLVVGGPHAVQAALSSPERVVAVFGERRAGGRVAGLLEQARRLGVPTSVVGPGETDRLAGVRSQGIAARIVYQYAGLDEILAGAGVVVALDGVTDPHNLGAVIRSAEAAGARGVIIPARRSAAVGAVAMRSSAGAAARLPVARVTNLVRALEQAGEAGFWRIGLSQGAERLLEEGRPGQRVLLVLGSEGEGLRRLVAETCDELARIPMAEPAESLNVSVAAAVALYRVRGPELFGTQTVDRKAGG